MPKIRLGQTRIILKTAEEARAKDAKHAKKRSCICVHARQSADNSSSFRLCRGGKLLKYSQRQPYVQGCLSLFRAFAFLLTVASAVLFTGCNASMNSQPAPAAVLTKLRALELRADSLPHTPDGRISLPRGWNAPDELRVPMKLDHGLPSVACRINGHEVSMFLDTGSQRTVLEAVTALKCGVRVINPADFHPNINGTKGIEPALVGLPDTMQLGDWHWKGLPCLVRTIQNRPDIDGHWNFNILGMDALHGMCSYVTLDYLRNEAVFGFRKEFVPPSFGVFSSSALEVEKNVPIVVVEVGDKHWRAVLDTGATMPVVVDTVTALYLDWTDRFATSNRTLAGLGVPKPGAPTRLLHVPNANVRCLGSHIKSADVLVVPDSSKIGSGLLRYFKTTLDFTRNRVWLEYPPGKS